MVETVHISVKLRMVTEIFMKIFALLGVFFVALILYYIFADLIDAIKRKIRKLKRLHDAKHRFDKPPVAKCYCIDCRYCKGYRYPDEIEQVKRVTCELDNTRVVYDSSFCSEADPSEINLCRAAQEIKMKEDKT